MGHLLVEKSFVEVTLSKILFRKFFVEKNWLKTADPFA